ncbi:hypothetical protein V1525DRAFT_264071 [Lipomyces kononenkoae]|uniref:Uncharacterized protein n=1 Tax=Lipomyces kononenkoae TaxID=34357 RepID=A0ACC3T8M1_LIPKO
MFQVLGPSASPVKKIVLPSSSPDQIGRYMQRPLDDHPYSTKSHSLPTPTRKAGRPRKNKAGIIAIVPPADSVLRLPTTGAGPQTPPPTASRAEHGLLRSHIPATPQSDLHRTTGSKSVPHQFITPQSSSRPQSFDFSLSPGRPWPSSSSPLTSPGGNGLGIFVNEPGQPGQPRHDVDPAMIYPDQKDFQSVNKYNTYTTLFRSPIQYPPYLGQRSLSNFEALSSSAMYGSRERKRARTRTRSWTGGDHPSSRSPTLRSQPQTPMSVICFSISETGQAVIEYKDVPPTPESRSRVLSSSTSISTESSSTCASVSDDPDADHVSEAETEIFDPKHGYLLHGDARVAMAKVLHRQQALLRRYHEHTAIGDPQQKNNDERKKKHHRQHAWDGKRSVTSGDFVSHENTQAYPNANSTVVPDRHNQSSPRARGQEPLTSQQLRSEAQQRWRTDQLVSPPGHLLPQEQMFQPQAHGPQVTHSPAEEASKEAPKRKRGRPPKKQQQQYGRKDGDAVTRCVCGHNEFVGAPMIQCDSCTHWLHMLCVNLDPRVRQIGAWYCPHCIS